VAYVSALASQAYFFLLPLLFALDAGGADPVDKTLAARDVLGELALPPFEVEVLRTSSFLF
jgi:hypothetical protein